jgi:Uma2 family endonuclease
MATVIAKPATLHDFLRAEAEAPEGTRLALIDGEIIEWGANITTRGTRHSSALARLCYLLYRWLDLPMAPPAGVGAGEVRCRLQQHSERVVGIDIGLWIGAEFVEPPADPPLYDAPPTLAIEILSPSDTNENVWEKIHAYLNAGVPRVWLVDPELKTVTVHRPDAEPILFNMTQAISDDILLPGLTLPIAEIFRIRSSAKSS